MRLDFDDLDHIFKVTPALGQGDGAGKLPVPGCPAIFTYSRARACCACSRCRMGGLFLCFSSIFHF